MDEPGPMLHGGAAPEPVVATLGEALLRSASGSTARIVHLDPDRERGYARLRDDAAAVLTGIRAAGVPQRALIMLRLDRPEDLLTAFWACLLGSYVPVPVPAAVQRLPSALDDAHLIADVPPADRTRYVGSVPVLARHPPAARLRPGRSGDVAVVMLTSGSSGTPKAVTLTHRNVLARAAASSRLRGLDQTSRSFNWMPLDHTGGLLMSHVRDVYLGAHQVHAPTSWVLADPLRWLDAADRHRADTTWAPNYAFALVAERAAEIPGRGWDLRRLRYILNGGEAVNAAVARRFLRLLAPAGLPATAVHPGWGASETSGGVLDHVFDPANTTDDQRYVPVGTPHGGVSVRVVGPDGRAVPPGHRGRMQVAGLPVTSGYLGGSDRSAFVADGWFVTDDLAFVRDGLVTVTGRADDTVETATGPIHGHEIEAVIEELACVTPACTVARALPDAPPAVLFHPRSGSAAEAATAIRTHVRRRLGVEVGRIVPIGRDEVPRTSTGKVRRGELIARLTVA